LGSLKLYQLHRPTTVAHCRPALAKKSIVARQVNGIWEIRSLDNADGTVPVVWREPAGVYADVYGEKTIRARNAVIILAKYESWSILYAWSGTEVKKIWLSD
jgi:hypothetical protein